MPKPKLTYDEWYEKIDSFIGEWIGLGVDDLPDMNYRDMYDQGDSPRDAALAAMENADFSEL